MVSHGFHPETNNNMTTRQKVIALRNQGKTYREISNLTGYSQSKLIAIFRHAKLITQKRRISDPDFLDRVAKLRKKGRMIKDIAEIEGCSQVTVCSALKRRGM